MRRCNRGGDLSGRSTIWLLLSCAVLTGSALDILQVLGLYASSADTSYDACVRFARNKSDAAAESIACHIAFQTHLAQRLDSGDSFDARLSEHLGSGPSRDRISPPWAWLRSESIQTDLERVYERVTGLRYPPGHACTLPAGGHTCYARFYGAQPPAGRAAAFGVLRRLGHPPDAAGAL